MLRLWILTMATVLAAGCVTVESNGPALRARSASAIGCSADGVMIAGLKQDANGGLVWSASGCDRTAVCSAEAKDFLWGASGRGTRCEETRDSSEGTSRRIVLDRLALETGCTDVAILTSSEWSRGGERSYRMEACGKRYVCTTAPGRTDCKVALE